MKIRLVGAELFRADEQSDRQTDMTKLIVAFRNFANNLHIDILVFNPLNAELNPICYLLALLGAYHFFHVSRIRVKSLTLKPLMSYIYIWSAYS